MSIKNINISNIRREYISGTLNRKNITNHPITLFSIWLNQAYSSGMSDPTAMCLATVDHTGQPYQRLVLLKKFTHKKMMFFTHFHSRKATHLTKNSKVSLCFSWNIIDRQVIILGNAYKLPKNETFKYFYSRPKDSQISVWVSQQSKKISSKKILENKLLTLKKKFTHKKVPLPKFWGGYAVNINSIEFWQGGINRLHDRFIYQRYKNKWLINRLSP